MKLKYLQVVECQFLECTKLLLDHGAQADVVDINNSTSLHLAAANGDVDIAGFLLEREAHVDAQDKVIFEMLSIGAKKSLYKLLAVQCVFTFTVK